jgi:hypothetical protein
MSTPTFTEEQIKRIARKEARAEIVRILETGMVCTAEADAQMNGEKPSFKNLSDKAVPVKPEQLPKDELPFNPELCNWTPRKGDHGDYEACREGTNFTLLKVYLESHEGAKASVGGRFYWLFERRDQIGRKPKKA